MKNFLEEGLTEELAAKERRGRKDTKEKSLLVRRSFNRKT
jgi:hypothetical protein